MKPLDTDGCEIFLLDPEFPHNVGGAIRAAHIFGAGAVMWSGTRVLHPTEYPEKYRLPREERMKEYRHVHTERVGAFTSDYWFVRGLTPVAVEIPPNGDAEELDHFEHPERALYFFGPEDGTLPKTVRSKCERFVVIPTYTRTPLNLSAAINCVLMHRYFQWRMR